MTPKLSAKQARFVEEYLIDLSAAKAAIRAGYSPDSAETNGPRLLRNAQIKLTVARGRAEQGESAGLSAARVLEEYRRLSFIDLRSFFDAAGNLKPIQEWTAEQGAAVASFEVIKKNAAAGDGVIDTVHKFKVWDKTRALESLAKHFGLLVDKVEHGGALEITWKGDAD